MQEVELKKRAEEAAMEGDEKLTRPYETLIEIEKCKSKWRKIKYHLKTGDIEPLTRLLVTEERTSSTSQMAQKSRMQSLTITYDTSQKLKISLWE